MKKAHEKRRIAKRCESAPDIGDKNDEKDHHMGIVGPRDVSANQRPDQYIAAPVVPTMLAINVPSASTAVLINGVPGKLPVTRMPPATV